MALALMGDLQTVGDRLNNVWGHEHPDYHTNGSVIGIHTESALALPPKLDNLAERLHELGPAAKGAQLCVYHLRAAKEYMTTRAEDNQAIAFDPKRFYDHLWSATGGVTGALNAIDIMFETKFGALKQ